MLGNVCHLMASEWHDQVFFVFFGFLKTCLLKSVELLFCYNMGNNKVMEICECIHFFCFCFPIKNQLFLQLIKVFSCFMNTQQTSPSSALKVQLMHRAGIQFLFYLFVSLVVQFQIMCVNLNLTQQNEKNSPLVFLHPEFSFVPA